jgi:beta-lactamase superfamily II metal-dependent hydrolase
MRFERGDAAVIMVAGWADWTEPGATECERRNALSIVVRLDYWGRSVVLTGDTVGRRLNDQAPPISDRG